MELKVKYMIQNIIWYLLGIVGLACSPFSWSSFLICIGFFGIRLKSRDISSSGKIFQKQNLNSFYNQGPNFQCNKYEYPLQDVVDYKMNVVGIKIGMCINKNNNFG